MSSDMTRLTEGLKEASDEGRNDSNETMLSSEGSSAAAESSVEAALPLDFLQRQPSAAEVLEAACNYSPPTTRKVRRTSGRLYPSVDLDVEGAPSENTMSDEEKKESAQTDSKHSSAMAIPATFLTDDYEVTSDPFASYSTADYTFATATATSQDIAQQDQLNDYDSEMLAMKRAAAGLDGGGNGLQDAPNLLLGESVQVYDERNRDYFEHRTRDLIKFTGRDLSRVSPQETKQEAMNLARRQRNGGSLPIEQTAQVLSITNLEPVHPSDLVTLSENVHAELIGQDFSRIQEPTCVVSLPIMSVQRDEGILQADSATVVPGTATEQTIVPLPLQQDAAMEATVIDSAPMPQNGEDGEVPLWKYFDAEEAQVLHDDATTTMFSLYQNPHAVAMTEQAECPTVYEDDLIQQHQEAQVLAIQDDQFAHPLELLDNDATAELVGEDYSAVAIQLEGEPAMPTQVTATMHKGSSRDGNLPEVHATLVQRSMSSGLIATAEAVPSTLDSEPSLAIGTSRDLVRPIATTHAYSRVTDHVAFDNRVASQSERSQSDLHRDSRYTKKTSQDALHASVKTSPHHSETRALAEKTIESERSDESVPDWMQLENARAHFVSPPPPQRFGTSAGPVDRENSSPPNSDRVGNRIGSSIARGTSNVMESLFGESKPPSLPALLRRGSSANTPEDRAAQSVRPRTLLPWSVIFSPSSRMWVATLQTNQKALDSNNVAEASRSLRAFSLPTEKQAICLAKSWTPPRMLPFGEAKACHIGQTKFALLKRPCHCKNCGVVVCRDCTVTWPSKMLPDTYNRKDSGSLNVCKSCDWLCNAFRLALLEGDFDQAVALVETGNININSPFGNVKGELFFPVHCAVLGGNIQLLRWLVDEHCSPIKSLRVSGKAGQSSGKYTPIVTSKGRSLLGIAMELGNVPIVRYLVVEKGLSLGSEKDITPEMLVSNLQAILHLIPADVDISAIAAREQQTAQSPNVSGQEDGDNAESPLQDGRSLSQEAQNYGAVKSYKSQDEDASEVQSGKHQDECVICFDNRIDCVANPCGHQIMCMRCASNISRCPVCASECTFLKVYKP
ncbi:hypothetical protein MPSEU_001069700 [Mayamaea pseudoterrestris]|nr:hypothetical protein MPSEU_001069700 [Mayamaea pseudoterrestris]